MRRNPSTSVQRQACRSCKTVSLDRSRRLRLALYLVEKSSSLTAGKGSLSLQTRFLITFISIELPQPCSSRIRRRFRLVLLLLLSTGMAVEDTPGGVKEHHGSTLLGVESVCAAASRVSDRRRGLSALVLWRWYGGGNFIGAIGNNGVATVTPVTILWRPPGLCCCCQAAHENAQRHRQLFLSRRCPVKTTN
jgi:hypothetical protein